MLKFESSVISYGSKTDIFQNKKYHWFESSVISYGSKTQIERNKDDTQFESSVISYGSKTIFICILFCY